MIQKARKLLPSLNFIHRTRKDKKGVLFKRTVTIALLTLSTLIASELVYLRKRKPSVVGKVYIHLANNNLSSDQTKTFKYFKKAIPFYILQSKVDFPEYEFYKVNLTEVIDKLTSDQVLLVKQKLPQLLEGNNNSLVSNLFYHLSLYSYTTGNINQAIELMKLTVNLDPPLSFPQIELANMLLKNNQKEKGFQALRKCTSIPWPKNHCEIYLKQNAIENNFYEVGYFINSTNEYQLK